MRTRVDRWSGSESCGFCLQTYVYALEVHCTGCDRPVCPLCLVTVRIDAQRFCPPCADDAQRPRTRGAKA